MTVWKLEKTRRNGSLAGKMTDLEFGNERRNSQFWPNASQMTEKNETPNGRADPTMDGQPACVVDMLLNAKYDLFFLDLDLETSRGNRKIA